VNGRERSSVRILAAGVAIRIEFPILGA